MYSMRGLLSTWNGADNQFNHIADTGGLFRYSPEKQQTGVASSGEDTLPLLDLSHNDGVWDIVDDESFYWTSWFQRRKRSTIPREVQVDRPTMLA